MTSLGTTPLTRDDEDLDAKATSQVPGTWKTE